MKNLLMKHFFLVIFFVFVFFTGCATAPTVQELANIDYGPYPQNYEETIKEYFNNILIDPYSAHYEFDAPIQKWVKDPPLLGSGLYAGYMVQVTVNAKNRLGGYVGKKLYGFIINNERIIKVMNEHDLENMRNL